MKKNKSAAKFVVCVWNDDGETDLEVLKIHRELPDHSAEEDGMIRVIDESGEDYLYRAKWFLPLDLPRDAEKIIEEAAELELQRH